MTSMLRNRYMTDGVAAMSNERILLALFDRLLADLDKGEAAIGARQIAGAHEALIHAQRIVEELYLAVDTDVWADGKDLVGIYLHAQHLLVEANLHKDAAPVRACREMIAPLAGAWRQAYETTRQAAPVRSAVAGSFNAGA
jgi:flagellar protein FliS